MSAVTITGRLVSADLPENADPEYEGVIHVQAQMGHEETIYKVAVPTGLMDSVMPGLWNERVSVQASLDDTIAMYMMETADPAGDGEPDGRRDMDGLESSAPTITMAELTEELERVSRGQDDSRKAFIRSDGSQIEITGVSNTTAAVYIVMGTLVEPMAELAMVEIERGYDPPTPHRIPVNAVNAVNAAKAQAYDLLAETTLQLPADDAGGAADIHTGDIHELGFRDSGRRLTLFMRIRDRIALHERGYNRARLDREDLRGLLEETPAGQ